MCADLLQPLEVDNPLCWIRLVPTVIFVTKCCHSLAPMLKGNFLLQTWGYGTETAGIQ